MIPPLIWALGFANLPLIYGLGAASLPVIIHLLNRRKFREERWAAMRFLLAAIRKNQRRIRLEQLLLLLVRTLIIAFLVLAMAKPYLESAGALPIIAGRRTHRVFVLDGSMSMGYATADATRFDQAKGLAARLAREARRGDALSVVLMADPPRVVIGDPSPNHAEVVKEIEQIAMPQGGTDLTSSLQAVDRVLDVSTIPQKEVIFLTDAQTASWRGAEGSARDGLKRVLARIAARGPRTVLIDLGQSGSENRAIVDMKLNVPLVVAGSSALVRATLKNFGPRAAEGVTARLTIDGRLGPEQVVDLPVGEEVSVAFTQTFPVAGDHLVEVKIDDDPLILDNRRWLSVPVRENLSVLLVDGAPKSEKFASETDYLATALSPESTTEGAPSTMRVEVAPESQLTRRDLAPYDAIALCNVARFTQEEVNALDDYLKLGGGVIVFGGDQVVPENYNQMLFADGKGLLPAAIGPTVGDASKKARSFGFDAMGFKHPIVAPFAGESDSVVAGLTSARSWQYETLRIPPGSSAQVALAFEGGNPAVVERPRHRGRVIQVATSADADWTTWPLHHSYPPIMEQMVYQAASGRLDERNVRVGRPLEQSLPAAGSEAPASVRLPDGREVSTRLPAAGSTSRLNFEETEICGPYLVKIGPPIARETQFAVNPEPLESDPAKLDKAGLTQALPGLDFAYLTSGAELSEAAGSVGGRGELHRGLLEAMLVLILVETVLAWIFGHHPPRS